MVNNIQTESFLNKQTNKTTVNIYKTQPGNYFVVRAITDLLSSQHIISQNSALSPGLQEFYRECLRKPMFCDMSNNGIGINYVFCETLNICAVCVATVNITNNINYNMNYKIYTIQTGEMPQTMPNVTNIEPTYNFSTQGQIHPLVSTVEDIQYSELNGAPGTFGSLNFDTQRAGATRSVNKYSICSSKPIICTFTVDFELTPPMPFEPVNPLNGKKFTFNFEVDNFSWDAGGNLIAISASHQEQVGENQTADITLVMDQNSGFAAAISIIGQNFVGIPPTQTIISSSVSLGIPLLPLSDFSLSTNDDFAYLGGESGLGGWAAGNTFASAVFDVAFSDMFPGVLSFSPEPIFR